MTKTTLLLKVLLIALASAFLVACDDDDDDPKPTQNDTLSLYTKDYTIWHYFSFENGVIGTGSADPTGADDAAWKARVDWDLAFHYKDVRTNSGKSGDGQGGMIEATKTEFSLVTEAPTTGYLVDDDLDIRLTAAMPPAYVTSTANAVCDDWASYNHDEHAWVFVEKVFIVKTAGGKYAKIWLKSFLDNEDASGTITMDYAYQADGSTNLE
ncbi:MAG: HmuY family protein [Bacteroidales bacterium]|nr:HmuY family protein [Bacteroidales bacterium]